MFDTNLIHGNRSIILKIQNIKIIEPKVEKGKKAEDLYRLFIININ